MNKNRLEAFSDGVVAIIITIMVLEMKTPIGNTFSSLGPVVPVFLSYVLSFTVIGIYWNNHHHLIQTVSSVNGKILWANLHLLFWLSVVPFTTNWLGEHYLSSVPVALYGINMVMAALAFYLLSISIMRHQGKQSLLSQALGDNLKGKLSVIFYLSSIPLALVNTWISIAIFVIVAVMYFIPDRRIEKVLK